MAIIPGHPDSFFVELLKGTHNFSSDTFKIALYGSGASLGPETTTIYTTTGEIVDDSYDAGGIILSTTAPVLSSRVAVVDFADATWSGDNAAFSNVYGAMIYNSSKSNKAVLLLNFGAPRSPVNSVFTITFPVANNETAIIKLGAYGRM